MENSANTPPVSQETFYAAMSSPPSAWAMKNEAVKPLLMWFLSGPGYGKRYMSHSLAACLIGCYDEAPFGSVTTVAKTLNRLAKYDTEVRGYFDPLERKVHPASGTEYWTRAWSGPGTPEDAPWAHGPEARIDTPAKSRRVCPHCGGHL